MTQPVDTKHAPLLNLNTGAQIPAIGLGVFQTGTSRQKGRLLDAYSVRSATIG